MNRIRIFKFCLGGFSAYFLGAVLGSWFVTSGGKLSYPSYLSGCPRQTVRVLAPADQVTVAPYPPPLAPLVGNTGENRASGHRPSSPPPPETRMWEACSRNHYRAIAEASLAGESAYTTKQMPTHWKSCYTFMHAHTHT